MAEKKGRRKKTLEMFFQDERDLAQMALAQFQGEHFDECLRQLQKIHETRPKDLKVIHNRIVAKFHKRELKNTDQFSNSLKQVGNQVPVNIEDPETLKNADHCVLFYNQAVVLYHLQQYQTALKIMNKVFTFVEELDNDLKRRVCLLTIDLHLCTQQPAKALSLTEHIEGRFLPTEEEEEAMVFVDEKVEKFMGKLQIYKIKSSLSVFALRSAERILDEVFSSSDHAIFMSSLFLKANLEYLRGNPEQALNFLCSISLKMSLDIFREIGDLTGLLSLNDQGCIYHYQTKKRLAALYLQKALQENTDAGNLFGESNEGQCPMSQFPLYCLSYDKTPILLYNLGIALLHGGNYNKAFECLMQAVEVYPTNPRLWLRVAECCIMAHKESNAASFDFKSRRHELVQGVVGSGAHRKIILNPAIWDNPKYSPRPESSTTPQVSLEYASFCLDTALKLLRPPKRKRELPPAVMAPPLSRPVDHTVQLKIRASVLAASAYVALCRGNHAIALEHANALLTIPDVSGIHKLLGRLYAGEAYIMLNRIEAAVNILDPSLMADLDDGDTKKKLVQWFPATPTTARSVLRYNTAVALTLLGDLDGAKIMLKQAWISKGPNYEVPVQVVALVLYIELLLGNIDLAIKMIKMNCPQVQK